MEAEITTSAANTEVYTVFNRTIKLDYSRDSLLTDFGKHTLTDRYLWAGENYQKMFARVAAVNSDDTAHAQRLYDYMSKLWFMPSTPVLSNSGHSKNLPISCFLNSVGDNLEEIFETLDENNWLASRGGGIGTNWSEVRSIGESVGLDPTQGTARGETSGIIPFIKMMDSATIGISQGSLRRGSAATYLRIDHPEIEEFLDVRRPTGDSNRRSLNLHHGVVVTDRFMEAVKVNEDWNLFSPWNATVIKVVKARALWQKLVTSRLETGEPYIWFVDTVNDNAPAIYKKLGLKSSGSNLCSEISLSTDKDYNNRRRTAVCCLSSLNLETYGEWIGDVDQVVLDLMNFLDNVLQCFIDKTDGVRGFERARYAAMQERSIGLGVMGFHGFLQSKMIPFEGVMAKVWNKKIFSRLKEASDKGNLSIAINKGSCPDAIKAGYVQRFTHVWAIAPTASISVIAGNSSPGVEPNSFNGYKQKTLSGWYVVKNKWLDNLLSRRYDERAVGEVLPPKSEFLADLWSDILGNDGSVQHLPFLTKDEKDCFKTAFEIDQMWIIELGGDRQIYICQGQSINVFIRPDVNKLELNRIHMKAWEKKLKGLYYCRSRAINRASTVNHEVGEMPQPVDKPEDFTVGGDECLVCQ